MSAASGSTDKRRQHFSDPDGEHRLITHRATPGIIEVLQEAFGVRPISREDYYEAESDAMGMQPAEGK